jgi:transposase
MLTEAGGIPVGVVVAGANRHDMKLVRETIESLPVARPEPGEGEEQGVCLDKGYDYDEVSQILEEFGFTAHIWGRGEEAQAIRQEAGFKARWWVVERTHSWLDRFRRLLVRWEKKAENYLGLLHFACGLVTLRAAGLFG